jgi:integrase
MDQEQHDLFGGRLHVYKRPNSHYWQCSAYLAGKNRRISTKAENLDHAKVFAENWYLEFRGKHKAGQIHDGKTFAEAAEQFLREYEVITEGQRCAGSIDGHQRRLKNHLLPFFGDKALTQITPGLVQEFRIHRRERGSLPRGRQSPRKQQKEVGATANASPSQSNESASAAKAGSARTAPSRSSMHKDIVTLRQVLKTATRHGWLQNLPDLSEPYKTSGKIVHRAWFSPEEYKRLYEATRDRALKPPKKRWKWSCEQMHDYVLFMANTGLRPDEAARLEFRDVAIVDDEATGETILEIEVRGKRGVGYCKSTKGAVGPFKRLKERLRPVLDGEAEGQLRHLTPTTEKRKPQATDRLFPFSHRQLFNRILDELDMKQDREGQLRTSYSLRHTYICLRLMEGADIYQIAKNCRTSVEMIETFYASHIKTSLDAAAINIRRSTKNKFRGGKGKAKDDERPDA